MEGDEQAIYLMNLTAWALIVWRFFDRWISYSLTAISCSYKEIKKFL
nr:MAG TPA: hypothetical protein [Caudoviricetes sp.]